MMNFILQHWYTIAVIVVFICGGAISVFRFTRMTKAERHEQIKAWLLQAVMLAERDFGSGTGSLKLSNVYSEFCKQLPWLAKIIPFTVFSKYVDEALVKMREELEKNDAVAQIVEGV